MEEKHKYTPTNAGSTTPHTGSERNGTECVGTECDGTENNFVRAPNRNGRDETETSFSLIFTYETNVFIYFTYLPK